MAVIERLTSAYRRHGAAGFGRLLLKNLMYYSKALVSGRLFKQEGSKPSEFDEARGTDTEAIREVGSLAIHSDNARYAVRYQPSPYGLAREVIHDLPIDFTDFTFLDFGAGKGRVLLIAGELPFAAIFGIEFSGELCEIANKNIAKMSSDTLRAIRIECIHADATEYEFPETPLVCYFYNPFGRVILQSVVDRLLDSLNRNPRETYIVYLHPEHRDVFDAVGKWELIQDDALHVVFRFSS